MVVLLKKGKFPKCLLRPKLFKMFPRDQIKTFKNVPLLSRTHAPTYNLDVGLFLRIQLKEEKCPTWVSKPPHNLTALRFPLVLG